MRSLNLTRVVSIARRCCRPTSIHSHRHRSSHRRLVVRVSCIVTGRAAFRRWIASQIDFRSTIRSRRVTFLIRKLVDVFVGAYDMRRRCCCSSIGSSMATISAAASQSPATEHRRAALDSAALNSAPLLAAGNRTGLSHRTDQPFHCFNVRKLHNVVLLSLSISAARLTSAYRAAAISAAYMYPFIHDSIHV